jgi:hypothetical protein
MKRLQIKIAGVHDLLLANNQMADPTNKYKKMKDLITKKKNKTDADHEELSRLDFFGHMYIEEGIGPVIYAEMLEAVIREGSKSNKRGSGKQSQAGSFVVSPFYPLEYDGSKDMQELYDHPTGRFRDIRLGRPPGAKSGATILICRPRFPQWKITFEVEYNEEMLNEKDVLLAIETGGKIHGIGAYRPRYGRFNIVEFKRLD